MNNNDNDFSNALAKVLAYGIARINNMDMTHEEALELAGVTDVAETETPPSYTHPDSNAFITWD